MQPGQPSRLTRGATGIRAAFNPRRLALAAGGLFLLVLAATTGFELASGQPLAATVSGKHGSGTSLDGGTDQQQAERRRPASRPPSGTPVRHVRQFTQREPTVTVTVPASSVRPAATSRRRARPAHQQPAEQLAGRRPSSPTG